MSIYMAVLPGSLSFKTWATQNIAALPHYKLPLPLPVEEWRFWASQVLFLNNSLNKTVPLPSHIAFPNVEDWKKWGNLFVGNLPRF